MPSKDLKCPKCKQTKVRIENVVKKSSSQIKGPGLVGGAYNAARGVASVATLGIAGKVLPKARGKVTAEFKYDKVATCQNCGHSWKVK